MNSVATIEIIKLAGIICTLLISLLAAWKSNKNGKKINEVHLQINSWFDEFLKIAKQLGNKEGREDLKKEQDSDNNKN